MSLKKVLITRIDIRTIHILKELAIKDKRSLGNYVDVVLTEHVKDNSHKLKTKK